MNPATPTISFSVPNHTYGDSPFAVSAGSNSTGAFTYSVQSGNATISGATVTLTGTGPVTLLASQAAAGNYAAGSQTATFNVASEAPTISFSVPNHTYGDAPFAVSASSNSSGAFTYSVQSGNATISGSTVTLTGIGSVTLLASQAAAGNYEAGTQTVSFSVAAEAPTINFSVPSHTYGEYRLASRRARTRAERSPIGAERQCDDLRSDGDVDRNWLGNAAGIAGGSGELCRRDADG